MDSHSGDVMQLSVAQDISGKLFRLFIHDNDLDNVFIASIIGSPGMRRIRDTETRTLENLVLAK